MDSLLNRYRSIVFLLVALVGQLILLAYQVKNQNDLRLIRVWAIWGITPIARIAEGTRTTVYGIFHNYFDLHNARAENQALASDLSRLKLENQYLRNQLNTADRVKALAAFQKESPSRLLAARIIGTASTASNRIVLLDRGSNSEVEKGMGVITPDGIVGKVLAAYPTASQALLVTDPEFAAGVVSQKNHVRGILRGEGSGKCKVDNVQNEEKVDPGEMFFTSGDDRIFPRGLPVGKAAVVREGPEFKDILVYPAGLQNGPEEVLIVLAGVHQNIPQYEEPPENQKVYLGTPPDDGKASKQPAVLSTDADAIREKYQKIGALEGHKFGDGSVPNFNIAVNGATPPSAAPKPGAPKPAVKPATPGGAGKAAVVPNSTQTTPQGAGPRATDPAVRPLVPLSEQRGSRAGAVSGKTPAAATPPKPAPVTPEAAEPER